VARRPSSASTGPSAGSRGLSEVRRGTERRCFCFSSSAEASALSLDALASSRDRQRGGGLGAERREDVPSLVPICGAQNGLEKLFAMQEWPS
jgi:hypothetical protein